MDGIDALMEGQKAYLMYSDPPWGEGNLKYWCTMNRKMTGQEVIPAKLDDFIDQIFNIAKDHVSDHVLIEYGVRWEKEIKQKAADVGLKFVQTVQLLYRSGKDLLPLHLHIFTKTSLSVGTAYVKSVENTSGFKTLKQAIYPIAKPGSIILDPCCGMGYTAQAAKNTGMVFRGNELNMKRLEKTIARLKK